jgi:hypothetical protein
MNRIEELLNELPSGYRELALKNYRAAPLGHPEKFIEVTVDVPNALNIAFDWNTSPEGLGFWVGVADFLDWSTPLPKLPETKKFGSPCFYRVYRVGGKGPCVEHSTLRQAEQEATRLAAQHPGDSFEILKCLGAVRCTKPSTFWNDGVNPEKP